VQLETAPTMAFPLNYSGRDCATTQVIDYRRACLQVKAGWTSPADSCSTAEACRPRYADPSHLFFRRFPHDPGSRLVRILAAFLFGGCFGLLGCFSRFLPLVGPVFFQVAHVLGFHESRLPQWATTALPRGIQYEPPRCPPILVVSLQEHGELRSIVAYSAVPTGLVRSCGCSPRTAVHNFLRCDRGLEDCRPGLFSAPPYGRKKTDRTEI